jgi:hypothetical protein
MRRRVELFNDQHHDWQYRLADERCNAIFQKRSDLLSALP